MSHPPLPALGPAPSYRSPEPEQHRLSGGGELLLLQQGALPLVHLELFLPHPEIRDLPWGVTELGSAMLEEAAAGQSVQERSRALKQMGSSLSAWTSRVGLHLSISAHREQLDPTVELLAAALLQPDLRPEDWERVKREQLSSLRLRQEDGPELASVVSTWIFLGEHDHWGPPLDGTLESVEALQLRDVETWLGRSLDPKKLRVVAAGDLNGEALVASLNQHLQGWPETLSSSPTLPPPISPSPPPSRGELRVLDLPGASQSSIRVLLPGPGWSAGSLSAELLAEGLGGSFTAPLNRILREEKSYTYGAYARYVERAEEGLMVLSTSVFRDVTAAALQDLHQLLDEAHQGQLPAAEWERARQGILAEGVSEDSTLRRSVQSVMSWRCVDRALEERSAYRAALEQLPLASVEEAARELLAPEQRFTLLVGDWAVLEPQLTAAGLEPVLIQTPSWRPAEAPPPSSSPEEPR